MLVHALSNGSLVELATGLQNDLEPEAIRRCPVSGLIQSQLREQQCLGALVSGSGPSVFGLCRDLPQARTVAAALRVQAEPSWRIDVVQTLHPVPRGGHAREGGEESMMPPQGTTQKPRL